MSVKMYFPSSLSTIVFICIKITYLMSNCNTVCIYYLNKLEKNQIFSIVVDKDDLGMQKKLFLFRF